MTTRMISHHHQITNIFMKMYEDVAFKLSPAKFDLSFFRSQVNVYFILYMYVSMYVCMYACLYVCMFVCMYECLCACLHVCWYVRRYACMLYNRRAVTISITA